MAIRLQENYFDARETVMGVIDANPVLLYYSEGSEYPNVCNITLHDIPKLENMEELDANMNLELTYTMCAISTDGAGKESYISASVIKTLTMLSVKADSYWTQKMITRVWDGDYPSTVAIEEKTGIVYLVYFDSKGTRLKEFGCLTTSELEIFKSDLNGREPYTLKIDPPAMFMVLDGYYGDRHLIENVFVELNCGMPIKVFKSLGR